MSFAAFCFWASAAWAQAAPLVTVGQFADAELNEISGLAASRRVPGVYWAHNDSFSSSTLYAIKESGELLARVAVSGAPNVDWEDIASFEMDGRAWLAIADIGNNFALDEALHIYLLPEPDLKDTEVAAQQDYRFRFNDGPRDAESLAVDVPGRRFLIADKGKQPAGLYALPMQKGSRIAKRISDIPFVWPQRKSLAQPLRASWRATPTAMDLSPDGQRLLLLSYRHIMAFERKSGEDWAEALQRTPRWARFEDNLGYEAAAWSADGSHALLTHEQPLAKLFTWTPP